MDSLDIWRKKNNARSVASQAKKKGKIKRKPCYICGDRGMIMHHEDYNKPLEIIWLCKTHHYMLHQAGNSLQKMIRRGPELLENAINYCVRHGKLTEIDIHGIVREWFKKRRKKLPS